MTKNVTITNADITDFKVKIISQRKTEDGSWVTDREIRLDIPGNSQTIGIHSGCRLIIEEDGYGDYYWAKKPTQGQI
jgi:hypothetical protein